MVFVILLLFLGCFVEVILVLLRNVLGSVLCFVGVVFVKVLFVYCQLVGFRSTVLSMSDALNEVSSSVVMITGPRVVPSPLLLENVLSGVLLVRRLWLVLGG